jgi:hypothetical protein
MDLTTDESSERKYGRRVCFRCVPPGDLGPDPKIMAGEIKPGLCQACGDALCRGAAGG